MFADYVSWLAIERQAESNSDRFQVHALYSLCLFLYLTLSIVRFGIYIVSYRQLFFWKNLLAFMKVSAHTCFLFYFSSYIVGIL